MTFCARINILDYEASCVLSGILMDRCIRCNHVPQEVLGRQVNLSRIWEVPYVRSTCSAFSGPGIASVDRYCGHINLPGIKHIYYGINSSGNITDDIDP